MVLCLLGRYQPAALHGGFPRNTFLADCRVPITGQLRAFRFSWMVLSLPSHGMLGVMAYQAEATEELMEADVPTSGKNKP